jgi:hypothetical protein
MKGGLAACPRSPRSTPAGGLGRNEPERRHQAGIGEHLQGRTVLVGYLDSGSRGRAEEH